MLHHYNYSSPLSHFLSYHPLQEASECSNGGQTTPSSVCEDLGPPGADARYKSAAVSPNGKSFTIAAILGLSPDGSDVQNAPTDLTTAVVNLSVHQGMTDRGLVSVSDCGGRLQLPVGRGSGASTVGMPYPGSAAAAAACHQQQQHPHPHTQRTARSTKHLSSPPKKSTTSKSKRVRTIFTPEQLERLEAEFERQQYMVGPERLYLAHTLQLTEAQVKVWFQNRRIKWRKHHLEVTHQRLAAIKQQQRLLAEAGVTPGPGGATNTDTMDSQDSSNETDT